MKIFNDIGMYQVCLKDPNKSYIVGASEEANERFREQLKSLKYQPGMKLEECFGSETISVLNDPRQKEWTSKIERITSENYNDIMKIKGMPGSCFGSVYGYQQQNQIHNIMEEYYQGDYTREEIKQKVKNICMDMRVYLIQERHTDGYNARDNQQILQDIYEVVQKANVRKAVGFSLKKGKELAEQFEHADLNDWMYYDANDYNKSEDMKECIRQAISEMANEWNVTSLDFEEIEKNSKQVLDGGFDYHSVWQWQAWQRGITRMTDFNTAPPKDFSFFYKERKQMSSEQGYVEVGYGNQKWCSDVPFHSFDESNGTIEVFCLDGFAKRYLVGCDQTDCSYFLKKFEFFQKTYIRDDRKWWEML